MEPAAACGFQVAAEWGAVEEPAEVWIPAGFPVPEWGYMLGAGGCLQASVAESSGGKQLVEHCYYNSTSRPEEVSGEHVVVAVSSQENLTRRTESGVAGDSRASDVFDQVREEFRVDMDLMEEKMHRYPASLRGLGSGYTVPRIVAIGPYHHRRRHLRPAEKVKHAAAVECVTESGCSVEDVYCRVASAADRARHLYDKGVMARIGRDDFRHMMFFDACFLVQYMLMSSGREVDVDRSLRGFMGPNDRDIRHDVLLLENQIPWEVVAAVQMFQRVRLDKLVNCTGKGYLQHHRSHQGQEDAAADDDQEQEQDMGYKPPHFLGLLRHYAVGVSRGGNDGGGEQKSKNRSISISTMELAEMGITLTANKTMDVADMGLIRQERSLFADLSLAPLSLDRNRATFLVNMAALELCTVRSFTDAPVESSAVCSYLLLLAMLVYRVEDVHELRGRGVLQGGGGLTNQEALRFFTSLQGLRLGRCYNRVMRDIREYKDSRRLWTRVYSFYYRNKKTIGLVVTGVTVVATVVGTLASIKQAL